MDAPSGDHSGCRIWQIVVVLVVVTGRAEPPAEVVTKMSLRVQPFVAVGWMYAILSLPSTGENAGWNAGDDSSVPASRRPGGRHRADPLGRGRVSDERRDALPAAALPDHPRLRRRRR